MSDHARAETGYRARKAWSQRAWKEEKDRERARRAAQQVTRAATLTAELAAVAQPFGCGHDGKTAYERNKDMKAKVLGWSSEKPCCGSGGRLKERWAS